MSYTDQIGRGPAVAIAISAVLWLSACGGSTNVGQKAAHSSATTATSSSSTTPVGTNKSTQTTATTVSTRNTNVATPASVDAGINKFLDCMRGHGIDIPLSAISSNGTSVGIKGVNTASPKYQQAGRECLAHDKF